MAERATKESEVVEQAEEVKVLEPVEVASMTAEAVHERTKVKSDYKTSLGGESATPKLQRSQDADHTHK